MAEYIHDVLNQTSKLDWAFPFQRTGAFPIDRSILFSSLADATAYALGDGSDERGLGGTSYVGQIISVYEAATEDGAAAAANAYIITPARGLLKLAATTASGDVTADIADLQGKVTALLSDVAALEAALGNVYTKEEADEKFALAGDYATKEEAQGYANAKDEVIAAAKKAGDDAQDAVDALAEKVGTVADGKTVVKMIEEAQAAATYDDTELAGRVKAIEDDYLKEEHKTALEGAIADGVTEAKGHADTLNTAMDERVAAIEADYLTSEHKEQIDQAIEAAEESAVNRVLGYLAEDEVNVDFDTLKEVAAWIESDTTASAELVTRVSNIEKDYLKGTDKTALQGEIDALETFVGALPEGAASATVVAYIHEVVDALKIGDYAKAADLTDLAGKVATLEGKMTAVEEGIVDINEALKDKVDVAEGYRLMAETEGEKLAGIETGAQANKVETVGVEFDLTERHLTIAAIEQSKVTGLIAALEGKVDKVEGSRLLTEDEATKLEKLVLGENGEVSVSGKVAAGNVDGLDAWITARAGTLEGLSENNLTDTLLTKLEGIAAGAQVNIIDGVSDEFTIAADGKILGIKEISKDKVTGLAEALDGKVNAVAGKGLSSNDLTDELLDKLNASQANVLEGVSVAGTLLDIVEKQINIPVATADVHGVVKSSADENKVAVAADGTMEVNKLNVNKLVQTDGEYIIMNGGSATLQ